MMGAGRSPAPIDSHHGGWPDQAMLQEMKEKLSKEIEQLSYELNVTLPQAIATRSATATT